MSFLEKESGALTGEPVELYEFVFPDKTYYYTNSIDTQNVFSQNWIPVAINRGNIKSDNRKGMSPVNLTAPKDFIPSVLFSQSTRSKIPVRVYRTHVADAEVVLYGQWFISDVSFGVDKSTIRVDSIASELQSELPRFFYQFQCNHELYSTDCGVTPVFLTGTIIAIDAVDPRIITLSISAPIESQLGVITSGTQSRLVRAADGSTLVTLLEPFEGVFVGDAFSMHDRGCDRSYNTCKTVFTNGVRFGGMPFIPLRNLFDSGV